MSIQAFIQHITLKYLVVPKAPKVTAGKKLIACVGDSITFGAGVNGKKEQTWEYFLEQKLGSNWQVLNYGISGRTLQDEGDYPYTKEKFYKISRNVPADKYIIMLGTNDSKPYNWNERRYQEELIPFLKSYMELPQKPEVIVMLPPTCFVDPALGKVGYDILQENIHDSIVPIIRKTCEELGLSTIDLHTFSADHNEWFDDGVHPNEEGNKKLAEYIFAHLS